MFKGCRIRDSANISEHTLQSNKNYSTRSPCNLVSAQRFVWLVWLSWHRLMWHPSWSHGVRSMWMHVRSATCPSVLEGKSLQQIQRRITALKRLQNTLELPPLSEFEAFGRTYPLPLKVCKPQMAEVPVEQLKYLAGFFDGDGCVSTNSLMPRISIGVSSCSADALVFFRAAFGGGICNKSSGRGLQKPMLLWGLRSQEHCLAAAMKLQNYSVTKHDQLKMIRTWPSEPHERSMAVRKLSELKTFDDHVDVDISWEWLAGFFDAEGCIRIRPYGTTIALSISQKHRKVLDKIHEFLFAHGYKTGKVNVNSRSHHILEVGAQDHAIALLDCLLQHGLLLKRSSAEIALKVHELDHKELRQRIAGTVGNQKRYHRLDSDGCLRASKIQELRKKVKRSNNLALADQEELEFLREEHEYKNSITVYSTLRSDAKLLIAQGAQNQSVAMKQDAKRGAVVFQQKVHMRAPANRFLCLLLPKTVAAD